MQLEHALVAARTGVSVISLFISEVSHLIRNLDDGLAHGWNTTAFVYPTAPYWIHPDNFLNRGWVLFHQGGVVTWVHQDSDGYCTWIIPSSGCKMWCYFTLKPEYRNLDRKAHQTLMSTLCSSLMFDPERLDPVNATSRTIAQHPELGKKLVDVFDVEVIVLLPGDAL